MTTSTGDTMDSWHGYPKIYALGHRATVDILQHELLVQEKVDGSQFSFGASVEATDQSMELRTGYHLRIRSRGRHIDVTPDGGTDKLFKQAILSVIERGHLLMPEYTYRGEAITSPKHNVLTYDRTPEGGVILFDVNDGHEGYLPYHKLTAEGARIGFEVVPLLQYGPGKDIALDALLDTDSILGGVKVEGVVLKPITPYYGQDGKAVMAKFVSEAFKEKHKTDPAWQSRSKGSVVDRLVAQLGTEARWHKAVQHLREAGTLLGEPKDIGAIIAEVKRDTEEEEGEWLREQLFSEHSHAILRGVAAGVPEWYKRLIADEVLDAAD